MPAFITSRYVQNRDGRANHSAALVVASNAAEAEGLAAAQLRKSKPTTDGWYNYDVLVLQLSKEHLLEVAEQA